MGRRIRLTVRVPSRFRRGRTEGSPCVISRDRLVLKKTPGACRGGPFILRRRRGVLGDQRVLQRVGITLAQGFGLTSVSISVRARGGESNSARAGRSCPSCSEDSKREDQERPAGMSGFYNKRRPRKPCSRRRMVQDGEVARGRDGYVRITGASRTHHHRRREKP